MTEIAIDRLTLTAKWFSSCEIKIFIWSVSGWIRSQPNSFHIQSSWTRLISTTITGPHFNLTLTHITHKMPHHNCSDVSSPLCSFLSESHVGVSLGLFKCFLNVPSRMATPHMFQILRKKINRNAVKQIDQSIVFHCNLSFFWGILISFLISSVDSCSQYSIEPDTLCLSLWNFQNCIFFCTAHGFSPRAVSSISWHLTVQAPTLLLTW